MKIRKEQLLLPKMKDLSEASPSNKWMQSKLCELPNTRTYSFNSAIPTETIEELPSALLSKIEPDLLLSNTDVPVIVSRTSLEPLSWHQQDGVLRQAFFYADKDSKSEEKVHETTKYGQNEIESCVAIKSGFPEIKVDKPKDLSTLSTNEIIKINDYQIILSNDNQAITYHSDKKVSNDEQQSPRMERIDNSDFKLNEKNVSFSSFGSTSFASQNHLSKIFVKNSKNSSQGNSELKNVVIDQTLPQNKYLNKVVTKPVKGRKKIPQSKKISLKPTSSLLSQSALDYKNKNCNRQVLKDFCASDLTVEKKNTEENMSCITRSNLICTVKSCAEEVQFIRITNNTLPVTTCMNIIPSCQRVCSFNSNSPKKHIDKNVSVTEVSEKTHVISTCNRNSASIVLNSAPSLNAIEKENTTPITHSSCLGDQHILNSNTESDINDNNSNTRGIISEKQTSMHSDVLPDISCKGQIIHTQDTVRSEDYPRDQVEIILPSDMEHHGEHHTQEYTDNLLSQLSNSGVLPNMSCSQVTSVLNALDTSEKSDMNAVAVNNTKGPKEPVKCEPTDYVKIENLQSVNVTPKTKMKDPDIKYRVCELNKHTCFRCVNCTFLSLKAESVEKHWNEEHQNNKSKQVTRRSVKCFGCLNVFYSKYALQIHLLCDHNVTTEIQELTSATLMANKVQQCKRNLCGKSSLKYKERLEEASVKKIPMNVPISLTTTNFQPNVPSVITQSNLLTTPMFLDAVSVIMTEPTKNYDQKTLPAEEVPELPHTPSFSLFSEIQLEPGKEMAVITDYPTVASINVDNDVKNHSGDTKLPRRAFGSKLKKIKIKPGFEVQFGYRCSVDRCGLQFSSSANLDYHLQCHKLDKEIMFCPECGRTSPNWSSLIPHLWREHNIDIDMYSCKHCNYKTNSYSKLMNNHIKIHGDERPFLCDLCEKGFKTTKQLRNHKVIHRARLKRLLDGRDKVGNEGLYNTEPENICNICSRSFSDSRILKHHTENVHNKARPYLCTFCSHTASCKSSLRMHMRQHTGEKPFKCDECEYTTADHNSLRRHKMRHSGRRPYQCPYCTYNCIQATTYKAHLKSKHPGINEGLIFSCLLCPFRTLKKDNFLAHKAEHDLGGDPSRSQKKKSQISSENVQMETAELPVSSDPV